MFANKLTLNGHTYNMPFRLKYTYYIERKLLPFALYDPVLLNAFRGGSKANIGKKRVKMNLQVWWAVTSTMNVIDK